MSGLSAWTDYLLGRVIFRPTRHAIPCAKERVLVDVPWGHVECLVEKVHESKSIAAELVLLRFLGAKGRAEMGTTDPINRLQNVSAEIWIPNPPGFGASTGLVSLKRYASSALVVYDYLRQRHPRAKIWVYGQSFGSLAALYVAASRQVDALILRNVTPFAQSLNWHLPSRASSLGRHVQRAFPAELDGLANARACRAKCLCVRARGDKLAPPAVQQEVQHAYGGTMLVCDVEGGHSIRQLSTSDEHNYSRLVRELFHG